MNTITVRCGVRIGQAVRTRYTKKNKKYFSQEVTDVPDNAISPVAWNELAALKSGKYM
jgi:hypothetical protein